MRPTIRRAVGGVATLALAAGLVVATAAASSAHANKVTGTAVCNHDTGLDDVTWSIWNDYSLTETLSNATRVASQVNGHTLAVTDGNQSNGGADTLVATESVAPASGTLVLTVHGHWSDGYAQDDHASVTVPSECVQTRHVTVAATFTDQVCDAGTGTFTPGTYDAPAVAGTTESVTGTTSPGDTLTVSYTPDQNVVIDGSSSFSHTYPTSPTSGTCKPPHHPRIRHGYVKIAKYPSCLRSERFVTVVERQGVKSVRRTHGPERQRWVVRVTMRRHYRIRAELGHHGPWVRHVRYVVHLRHVGACHTPGPGSGRSA